MTTAEWMTLQEARDRAFDHAASILEKMRTEEMERIGLMVAMGLNTDIAEAVAAKLTEAAAQIRKRKRSPDASEEK